MKKFAFYNELESKAFAAAVLEFAPSELHDALIRLAQARGPALQFPRPAQQQAPSPAVAERLEELREMLRGFLGRVNLAKDPRAFQWVDVVTEKMRPALETSLKGQQSLEDQLAKVPTIQHSPKDVGPKDIVGPEDFHLLEPISAPRPPIVPKQQKMSPGNKSPLLRNQPQSAGHQASKGPWRLRRAAAVKQDEIHEAPYEKMILAMLEVADMADASGMYTEADALAAVLPALRTVKLAQYEGFQNYWIANGRAFEMAYKQKRSKGKDNVEDFRSPQEVWFEILDEYQKSLMTNQHDFISKYAGKEFSSEDRAASSILMAKISERIAAGTSPGVALYEAIEELGSGKHMQHVANAMESSLSAIAATASIKGNYVLSARANELAKEAAGWFGKLMRSIGLDYGSPTATYAKNISESEKAKLIDSLGKLYYQAKAAEESGNPLPVSQLRNVVHPLYEGIGEFLDRAKLAGLHGTPELPDLSMTMNGEAVNTSGLGKFTNMLDAALRFIRPDTAATIDKYLYERFPDGLKMPAQSYIDYFSGQKAPPIDGKPQPSPAAASQPKDAKATTSSFENALMALPADHQFDALTDIVKMVHKWAASPAGVAEMTKRKMDLAGKPYQPKATP